MPFFNNINELINTLSWSKELLAQMFEKRRSFQYKYDLAVEILDEDKITALISRGIIRQNGLYIELDDQFLDFFEQVLEVNEEINTSYINENILQIKQNINFYLQDKKVRFEINVDAGDVDAQRFYERHGFSGTDPDTGERAFYYSLEL